MGGHCNGSRACVPAAATHCPDMWRPAHQLVASLLSASLLLSTLPHGVVGKRGSSVGSLASGCNGVGDVHVVVFWHALGQRLTRAGIQAVAETPGIAILEVHVKRWPSSVDAFAACHRNFYANNHAEKGFTVPPRYFVPEFVAKAKGTGPFTVVLFAVDCESVNHVSVARCGREGRQDADSGECDNAPKAMMLLTLKRMLRKRLSQANKYAVHATVNGNEAVHDVTSLFGPGYYSQLVEAKHRKRSWTGSITTHSSVECVEPLQNVR